MAIHHKPPWSAEQKSQANQGTITATDKATREHNRFAHFHDAAIEGMYRNRTADGLKGSLKSTTRPMCDSCELVKAKTHSIKEGDNDREIPPFHTVAVDAIPIKPVSAKGNKWNFMYADRKTKTIIHDPRPSKKSALESFKRVNDYAKQRGFEIKRLQSDSEAIFTTSKPYQEYLTKHGIRPTYSAPYRHDQNGMLERQWQTQKNAGATVMKHGKIPPKYWDIVLPAVAKTWDVLPLKSTNYTQSPYELREGKKPDVSRFVPLGSKAYIRRYKDEPTRSSQPTLRTNAYLGKVIGYPDHEKGSYIVLTPNGGIRTRYDMVVNQDGRPSARIEQTETDSPGRTEDAQPDDKESEETSEDDEQQNQPTTTPSIRQPSQRTKPGPHPRHATDQIVEPGKGSRGRVLATPSAHMAAGDNPIDDPKRKPG